MKKSVVIFLHIGYWVLYLLLVSSFIVGISNGNKHLSLAGLGRVLFGSVLTLLVIVPSLVGFYSFYLFLFSRYLRRKKIIALIVSGVLFSIFCAVLFILLSSVLFRTSNNSSVDWADKAGEIIFLSVLILIHGAIGLIIKGFITWYADIKLKAELARKNYEMELELVKSQINPHFLFNTINNIDILIMKDADKASACLNKLSDIMRFMLYETKTDKIPLAKELAYIEKYIDLQKIRTSNINYVNYCFTGDATDKMIAPMLMIPFIENAFKYSAENAKNETAININITANKEHLNFTCENSYRVSAQTNLHGGLGNELIQKRLMLLYPNQHKLEITDKKETYKVNLLLNFHEN